MTLFLIRHGQTTANFDRIYSGQSDVKLTELGRTQAENIAPILANYNFDRVYSSDLSRAYDTARLAIPDCEPILTPLLREFDLGSITGWSIDKVRREYGPLKSDFSRFGGESAGMVTERGVAFLKMLEENPCQLAACFTHNGLMKGILRGILGSTVNTADMINDNCNIAVLKYENKKWKLAVWNLAGSF